MFRMPWRLNWQIDARESWCIHKISQMMINKLQSGVQSKIQRSFIPRSCMTDIMCTTVHQDFFLIKLTQNNKRIHIHLHYGETVKAWQHSDPK
jgi:hypothetical protein